jgi:hypothetical protein
MTLSNGQALVGAHIPTLVPLRETAKLQLDQRRRAGVLPPTPLTRCPCPARAGRRVAVEGRGRFCWRQGTGRPGRAPGPVLDLRHRWTILALLAHAFLSVLASQAAASHPDDEQLIPLTRHEIRRLLADLSRQLAAPAAQLHWSRWRRRHQATARNCHYRRRAQTPA